MIMKEEIRLLRLRAAAYKQAAVDVHLGGRAKWQSNGDIIASVTELLGEPVSPYELDDIVQAYDEILAIHEIERA
jgi:hypothetical protein